MAYIKKLKNNELIGGIDNTDVYPITSTKAVYDEDNVSQDYINKHITGDRIESNTITGDKLANKALTEEKVSDALMDKINASAHGVTEEFETEVREALKKVVNTVSVNNDTPLQPDVNKNINITVPEGLADLNGDSNHRTVTDAEKSTWSGKQDALTFDNVPTANSNNPVKSGGVYQAIQDIDVSSQISGKEDKSNKVTSFSSPTDTQYPSAKLVNDQLATKQGTISDLSTIRSNAAAGATAYQKPGTGIPKTDLASAVQTSLGKADTAIQSVTVGTTTTGAAGTNASVTNTGTATAPVLSFTIPQGAQGIQGIQGPQGERGPQGNTGVQVDSVASIIHSIDPTATYAAADVAGADAVQDVLSEVTELGGEVNNVLQKTVAFPTYEKGKISNTGTFTSDASYGTVRPIKLYDGDTIMLNLGSPLYHGYKIATLFRCDSTGTFIETLITGSGTSPESWTNTTGDTIYVGISGYKSQLGYIISKDIKSSFELLDEEIGDNINYSFDVAAGSSTPTTEKMEVDIAAGDIFYLKVSDTTGDGNAYELYFQYDGQSSGTKIGSVLSGTAYMYTASQKIDKIYLWKKAVSTNKTVRIDVWTGLLGQINLTESDLSTLKIATVKQAILSEAYTVASVTRNTSGNVTAASIVYPDGVTGTMTVTRNSAGAATSAVYTYGTSTYTLTITRDSNNNVTATSLS